MRAKGLQPNEIAINSAPTGPVIDEQKINDFVDMGYPFNAARKALYYGGGNKEVLKIDFCKTKDCMKITPVAFF